MGGKKTREDGGNRASSQEGEGNNQSHGQEDPPLNNKQHLTKLIQRVKATLKSGNKKQAWVNEKEPGDTRTLRSREKKNKNMRKGNNRGRVYYITGEKFRGLRRPYLGNRRQVRITLRRSGPPESGKRGT